MVLSLNPFFVRNSFYWISTCLQRFFVMIHSMNGFKLIYRSVADRLLRWQDKVMHIDNFFLMILQLRNIYLWCFLVHALCCIWIQSLFFWSVVIKSCAKEVISRSYVLILKFGSQIFGVPDLRIHVFHAVQTLIGPKQNVLFGHLTSYLLILSNMILRYLIAISELIASGSSNFWIFRW